MFLQPTFQLTTTNLNNPARAALRLICRLDIHICIYICIWLQPARHEVTASVRLATATAHIALTLHMHMVAGPASFDAGVDACNSILMPQNAELYHTRLVQMCRFYPAASQRQEQHYT